MSEQVINTSEPSFTNGQLKWVSASSLSTVNLCARRFWFDQIAKLPRKDRGFFKRGIEIDKQIEHYAVTGEDTLDKLARKIKPFIPLVKHLPGIQVKKRFAVIPKDFPHGLGLRGELDMFNSSGILIDSDGVEIRRPDISFEVIDIKTPKTDLYIKTVKELSVDMQLNIYAYAHNPKMTDLVALSHISAPKEKGEGRKVTAYTTGADNIDYFLSVVKPLAHRAYDVSKADEANKVSENLAGCTAYRVLCDFHDECPISQADKLYNINLINQQRKPTVNKGSAMPAAVNFPQRPKLFGNKPASPTIDPRIAALSLSLDGKDGLDTAKCEDCGSELYKLNLVYAGKDSSGDDLFDHLNCPAKSPSHGNPAIPEDQLAEPIDEAADLAFRFGHPQSPFNKMQSQPTVQGKGLVQQSATVPHQKINAADRIVEQVRGKTTKHTTHTDIKHILLNFGHNVNLIGEWPSVFNLDYWVDEVITKLADKYKLPDIRSNVDNNGNQSPLSYGNWKWVVAETIRRTSLPQPKEMFMAFDAGGCELRQAVVNGLVAKARDGGAFVALGPVR